jgi:hypothetical protein
MSDPMGPVDLFVSPDLVKEAQELSNPLLKVPDDAYRGKGDTRRWSERLQILGSSVEKEVETERWAFTIRFKVSALGNSQLNIGRNTRGRYLFNPTARGEDKDAFMSKITVNRLDALLRAVNWEYGDGAINYGRIFSDPDSGLVGLEVNAVLVDKPDHKDPSIRRQEVANFTPAEQ